MYLLRALLLVFNVQKLKNQMKVGLRRTKQNYTPKLITCVTLFRSSSDGCS